MRLFIGTSGWSYDAWRNSFYRGVPRRSWFQHYAAHFSAVEINASYYRLQQVSTYRRWYEATPPGFRFAIKANRYLPAYRRLREPEQSIALERERAQGLEEKLSVVLWLCTASFQKNLRRLEVFSETLSGWNDVRHAIEFRHPSWFDEGVRRCLREHDVEIISSGGTRTGSVAAGVPLRGLNGKKCVRLSAARWQNSSVFANCSSLSPGSSPSYGPFAPASLMISKHPRCGSSARRTSGIPNQKM